MEMSNSESTIIAFYSALAVGDAATIRSMVAEDLEWSFHGPPTHQHLMRMLTGADRLGSSFQFEPSRICMIGDRVFAEGRGHIQQPSSPSSSSSSSASSSPSRRARQQSNDVSWVHVWRVGSAGQLVELSECFNTSVTVTAPACSTTVWQSQASLSSMPGLVFAI